jgi:quinolinate synthase
MKNDILALKKKLNAVILAHSYQTGDIQDVADFVGDSLGLSQQAAKTNADVIVFCGVRFMAETAKILNPSKLVLLPDLGAGCSLEESCPASKLKKLQATNKNFYTVAYINCSAEVKAISDIICTSGNAIKVVCSVPEDRDVLFVPDENLGDWVAENVARHITLYKGNCYLHNEFKFNTIMALKKKHPGALILVHPESPREVRYIADHICSTEGMITYCKFSKEKKFIIVTESGIIYRLKKECPNKEFVCVPTYDIFKMPTDNCRCNECKYMKINTLEKLYNCMLNLSPQIKLSEEIIKKAQIPLNRMLALG